ncbi:MAG: hypothetical protein ACTFAK_10805 [Candidatus Electronema sp. VV]
MQCHFFKTGGREDNMGRKRGARLNPVSLGNRSQEAAGGRNRKPAAPESNQRQEGVNE